MRIVVAACCAICVVVTVARADVPVSPPPLNPLGAGAAPTAPNPLGNPSHGSAPPWVKPGLRLTFYGQSAVVPGSDMILQQNDRGEWIDKDGNRYHDVQNNGGGGTGFQETEIVAVHDDVVAYESRSFTIMPGRFSPGATGGGVAPAAQCGDTWIHPDKLRQMANMNADGVMVYRQPWKIGNKTYHAVCTSVRKPRSSPGRNQAGRMIRRGNMCTTEQRG